MFGAKFRDHATGNLLRPIRLLAGATTGGTGLPYPVVTANAPATTGILDKMIAPGLANAPATILDKTIAPCARTILFDCACHS
jgi:hypothetical protein